MLSRTLQAWIRRCAPAAFKGPSLPSLPRSYSCPCRLGSVPVSPGIRPQAARGGLWGSGPHRATLVWVRGAALMPRPVLVRAALWACLLLRAPFGLTKAGEAGLLRMWPSGQPPTA